MDGLTLKRLESDVRVFDVLHSKVYSRTYFEMCTFFQEDKVLTEKHLILFAQLIYGSMPTMVKINLKKKDAVIPILTKVRDGELLSFCEIELVKEYINNSLVGASKLLHFLNPKVYAIWDSRIHRYVTGKKSVSGIGAIATYLDYIKTIKIISSQEGYQQLHQQIQQHFDYEIEPSRVMEIIMFQTDKLSQNKL